MDNLFGKIKAVSGKIGELAAQSQAKAMDEYLPLVASLLREKAGPAVLNVLDDPDKASEICRSIYQGMPLPFRLVVKEGEFASFVQNHKDQILPKIRASLKSEGSNSTSPAGGQDADNSRVEPPVIDGSGLTTSNELNDSLSDHDPSINDLEKDLQEARKAVYRLVEDEHS